jgi:putative resolvase
VGRQAGRVAQEAGKRITLDATVTGVGSGVNGNRATLRKVLADPRVRGIVVEHRDRLARFGVERRRAEAGVRCVTAEVVAVVTQ